MRNTAPSFPAALESFGRLKNDLKLYIYPYQKAPGEPRQILRVGKFCAVLLLR